MSPLPGHDFLGTLSSLTLLSPCAVLCHDSTFLLLSHVSVLSHLCGVSFSLGAGGFCWGVGLTPSEADGVRKPPGPWKVSDLDIAVDPVPSSLPESHPGTGASTGSDGTSRECTVLRL